MSVADEREVPDLLPVDGFLGATWDPEVGTIFFYEENGTGLEVAPEDVRRLFAWVEENHLT